jgi:outer membrane receptor protein involved in Fe transport
LLFLTAVAYGENGTNNKSNVTNEGFDTNDITSIDLPDEVIYANLDAARSQILPNLGATAYSIGKQQIETMAQGGDAPFSQMLLRAPGVVQDSFGQVHVRGEHANLQYRINDVILPEGITGFGQELDPRFVDSMELITGSLPAQYGFRTAGIVDIRTKTGAFDSGGELGLYGGSYDTLRPSFEYGGSVGKLNFFIDGSYEQNGIGIENPTSNATPIHDDSTQFRSFLFLSYILDETSRVSLMASGSINTFQLPDTAGLPAGTAGDGVTPWTNTTFNSTNLNENQDEHNYYAVASFQKTVNNLNCQVSGFVRYSDVHYIPDPDGGDLYFNGVSCDVLRMVTTEGVQADSSLLINPQHTARFGVMFYNESLSAVNSTTTFSVDNNGDPISLLPAINDNQQQDALFYGAYLQDEWKIIPSLILNFGLRFDGYSAAISESQISPRINLIWEASSNTTLHAGYSKYFTPPPLETVNSSEITLYNGTANQPSVSLDDPVRAERADYFDAGISQKIIPELSVGLDGYYKACSNQLDDGYFGQTLIPSSFNYAQGLVMGVELTTSFVKDDFSSYANVSFSQDQGTEIDSAQFQFDSYTLSYISNHWINLDHEQLLSGSFGVSYTFKESIGETLVYADDIYGSGLCKDGVDANGNVIPNGAHVPAYDTINIGLEQSFKTWGKEKVKVRVDVVNLLDAIYLIRDGSGVGVNAPQYGQRRSIYGSLSYAF